MKITERFDDNKFMKFMKNKKAIKVLSSAMLMIGIAFGFGATMAGKYGLALVHDILMIWASVFILVFIGLFAWSMFFSEEQ